MKKQLEIDYAFGYVYDKSKLIVMYPAGTNVIDLDDYEMEVEVAFLEDGIDAAFEENDVCPLNILFVHSIETISAILCSAEIAASASSSFPNFTRRA